MSEMTGWLVQCGIIAAVLAAGAWVWERGARWSGYPARWGWLAALAGSVTLPFVMRLLPDTTWSEAVPPVGLIRLDVLAAPASATPSAPISAMQIGIAVWIVLSVLVLSYATLLLMRLARARRKWRNAEIDGAAVLVSRNVGPAAVGVRRGIVVIPAWALELDAELRQLMLLHEREHVRAGDPRVLLSALLLLAVMPWHPLVWLQLIRLRNAIELDCDARVLRHGADPAKYGSLLLEVGLRRGGNPLVFATFAEPRIFLEQRIRRIARWPLQRRPLRAALLGLIALALFSTSLLARVSIESAPASNAELGVFGTMVDAAERLIHQQTAAIDTPPRKPVPPLLLGTVPAVRPNPRQTPYTKAPVLLNTDEVMKRMSELYPQPLREQRIGGTVTVWLMVDAKGQSRHAQLSKPSGHAALDEAAVRVAQTMSFEPALNGQRAVPAWIEVPIAFGELAHSVSVTSQPTATTTTTTTSSSGPGFTPFKVSPDLRNLEQVQRALIEQYPPLLKDAGIGGTAVLWLNIDENGRVVRTMVKTSSGYAALDEAAGRVATVMQFSPALNGDRPSPGAGAQVHPVPVWIEIPIQFQGKKQQYEPEDRSRTEVATVQRASDRSPGVIQLQTITVSSAEQSAARGTQTVERPFTTLVRERDFVTDPYRDTTGDGAAQQRFARFAEQLRSAQQDPDIRKRPTFMPFTKAPELLNREEIGRALVREYPPLLRDAGIGGTTLIWFFINEKGEVENTAVKKTSGTPALDEASLRIAKLMRFTPAKNRDKVVPVWIEIPIQFQAK